MKKTAKITLLGLFGLWAYFITFAPLQGPEQIVSAKAQRGKMAFALASHQCHLAEKNERGPKGLKAISHWEIARSLTTNQPSRGTGN